jgi:hypothetical protein
MSMTEKAVMKSQKSLQVQALQKSIGNQANVNHMRTDELAKKIDSNLETVNSQKVFI